MSELSVFNFDTHAVRTLTRDGEPWFVAADVCEVLDIANVSQAIARLDDDETTLISTEGIHSGPGNPMVNVVNESGLYSLVLGSREIAELTGKRHDNVIRKTVSNTLLRTQER